MHLYLRKFLKVLKISSITLLLLLLAVYTFIQVPIVQSWLVQQATRVLTEKLQTKVAVQRVSIDFFKTAIIEGIYIEDRQSDTLLFAGKLKADIGIFSLFKKNIFVNKIQLENASVNLSKQANDSLFNFQFIIDAFSSREPKAKKTKQPSGWAFGIGKVEILDTRFRMADKNNGGFELETEIGNLMIDAKAIDFDNHSIALSGLVVKKSSVGYTLLKNDIPPLPDTSALAFPAFGWQITADELNLEDNHFRFSNLNHQMQADVVDYNFLNFEHIFLKVSGLSLQDTSISANVQQISLTDQSGFRLNNLGLKIGLNNKNITAENLRIETPESSLNADIRLSFNGFADLAEFMEKVKLEAAFDTSRIAYRDLVMLLPALRNIPVLKTDTEEKISLDGKIVLKKNNIIFESFDSKIGKSFSLNATGSIARLTGDPVFDLDIKKLNTNYAAVTALTKNLALPKGLAAFGTINFSGKIKGTINNLDGKQLSLSTESATQFKGDLNMTGLPDIENTVFKANIEELITQAGDLRAFSSTGLPALLDSLGLIQFKGNFEGTTHKFAITGESRSTAGGMNTDLEIDFEKDYKNAAYDGIVEIHEFDLAKILGQPFGVASLNLDAKGSGLNVDDLDITITGAIRAFNYKDYTYRDVSLNGTFFKKRFEGTAKATDENVRFDFRGMIDLNDSLKDMQMVLNIDTINLKALNLLDKNLGFRGNLEADLKGSRLDNINGIATLTQFGVTLDTVHYSTAQKILLEARSPASDQRALHFRSEFMDADITGKFNLADFPKSVIDFVNEFFPVEGLIANDSLLQEIDLAKEQDVAFNFQFKDIAPIAQLFLPDLLNADSAYILGNFKSERNELNFAGAFPNINYGELKIDTFHITSKGTPRKLETTVTLNQINSGEQLHLPLTSFHTLFTNDTLSFSLNSTGDGKEQNDFSADTLVVEQPDKKVDLKGYIAYANKSYTLSFFPELVLNNYVWKISPENKIAFDRIRLDVSSLNFLRNDQEITINSRGDVPENDFKPIEIRLSNFSLREISEILGMTDDYFGGIINGELLLIEPKTNLHYNCDILIKDLAYNEQLVGDLDIKAKHERSDQIVDLSVSLKGQSQMSIAGKYAIQERNFDLDFQFGRLPLFLIDPFMKGILKESGGILSGDMKLTGSPERPGVNGALKLSDFKTTVDITNMPYRFEESNIRFNEKAIELGTMGIKDANNNTAVLSGKILHDFFQDIRLDLNFNTDALQFLGTTPLDNELYYGNLFLKSDISVKGTPELPVISIEATTLPKSQLFVQPFTDREVIQQENYIIYGNPEAYNEDSLRLAVEYIGRSRNPFDLSLKLQVTKDATLNIVIDPATGDQLISIGTADLTLNINPAGVMTVVGNYTIDRGSYSLNYEQLVKRDFEIEKGSSIVFSGDPMDARFNVTAAYKLRASTYELLSSQTTLSDEEKEAAKVRTDVIVFMMLKGYIREPSITFDIQIPKSHDEDVGNAVNRKLAELRRNPEELNKQAFGLLLFKSFIAESGSSAQSPSEAGTAIALSSVSSLMSDQLNNFADRYVKGFEVNFDMESYNTSGNESQNVTRMNLSVSKQLFNDRLKINVGTNVNLGTEAGGSGSSYSGIAGDFELEYQLTPNGNYLVKVFHKSDYNVLEQNNEFNNGVGLIFRKSFNRKKGKK